MKFNPLKKLVTGAAILLASHANAAEKPAEKTSSIEPVKTEAVVTQQETTLENNSEIVSIVAEQEMQIKSLESKINQLSEEIVVEEEKLAVDTLKKYNYFLNFKNHIHDDTDRLEGKKAKEFSKVAMLPSLIENQLIEAANKRENTNKDFTSKEAVQYWADEFQNFDNPVTGKLIQTMTMTANENSLSSTDAIIQRVAPTITGNTSADIGEHGFLGRATKNIIYAVGKVIMQERLVESKKSQLIQLQKDLEAYRISDNFTLQETAQN